MGIGYQGTIVGFAVIALSTVAASAVNAQITFETPTTGVPNNIPDQLEQVYFSNDRDYFRNRTLPRQFNYIFGFGFTEIEIAHDGKDLYVFYQSVLARQMSSRSVIRTPDLPTPFNQSIRDISVEAARPVTPSFPPIDSTPPTPTTPLQTKPRVPALW
jgi:hypothetical protein